VDRVKVFNNYSIKDLFLFFLKTLCFVVGLNILVTSILTSTIEELNKKNSESENLLNVNK